MMPLLLLLFVLVPLVEIYVLVQVGQVVGAGWTVALVVLTAVLGAALLRVQGLATLSRVERRLNAGELPAAEVLEGVVLLAAGALLLTPGFVTDALGFFCLVPLLRARIAAAVLRRMSVGRGPGGGGPPPGGGRVIEGEWRRDDEAGP